MASTAANSLLSSSKASDSQIQVQLHPLVILIISDYVTRHTLRQQTGPIVGAILGAQNGREITMEHAFECKLEHSKNGDIVLDAGWFQDRLQQYKDVHKSPALDLVAWFALTPSSGPEAHHVPIHQQVLEQYNESALLLAFHPDSVADGTSKGSRLPITIYETAFEASSGDGDKHMQSSDEAGPQLALRFKELPYTVETGEAEMIGVDFVARGGANATVTNGSTTMAANKPYTKGKGKATGKNDQSRDDNEINLDILSQEDEELISSLTAKANAIRMLHQRISLIKAYLTSLPECYLNTPHASNEPVSVSPHPQISHTVLRTISSTLARLPLLTPPTNGTTSGAPTSADISSFSFQAAQQRSDVALVSLLGSMGTTIRNAQDMGKKAFVIERSRASANQMSQHPGMGSIDARKLGTMPNYYMGNAMGDGHGGMPDPTSAQGDEGYVDDYDEEDEEFDSRGGYAGGGGVPLSGARRNPFPEDAEMTE